MSSQTVVENTGNQAHITTDTSKIFLRDIVDIDAAYTNVSGGIQTLLAGTLMGRISATGLLLPLLVAAVDGSQFPVGILMEDITLGIGASATLTLAVSGSVAQEKVIFNGADTIASVVSGRQLLDRIGADTVGIQLVEAIELTGTDNA